jgi:hypothetical protein
MTCQPIPFRIDPDARAWAAEVVARDRAARRALLLLSTFGYAVGLAIAYANQLELGDEVEAEVWLARMMAPGGPGHEYLGAIAQARSSDA